MTKSSMASKASTTKVSTPFSSSSNNDSFIEEDVIEEEWDVLVGTELTPFLHILSLPTSILSSRYSSSPTAAARFKPHARRLEITLPLTDQLAPDNFDAKRMREMDVDSGQKLVGSGWPWRRVQYLVGQFNSNELHLTPVESVIPLNPSFTHLDEYAKSSTSSGSTSRRTQSQDDLNTNNPNPSSTNTSTARAIQVQFRKKETEEQVQARLNSYAHLQRQVDDEEWISLKHHSPKDPESGAVRGKLVSPFREPIEFIHDEDYLAKIINFDGGVI